LLEGTWLITRRGVKFATGEHVVNERSALLIAWLDARLVLNFDFLGECDLVELRSQLDQLLDLSLDLVDHLFADLACLLHLMVRDLGEVEQGCHFLLDFAVVLELFSLFRLR